MTHVLDTNAHTIEAVLELSAASQFCTIDFLRGQDLVQKHAQRIVAESRNHGLSVQQACPARPADFSL